MVSVLLKVLFSGVSVIKSFEFAGNIRNLTDSVGLQAVESLRFCR